MVREAMNKYAGKSSENKVELFISIATPFGGHPAAATGEKHGLIVLPAWRDVNPNNKFIKQFYRKPMPDFVIHHLNKMAHQQRNIVFPFLEQRNFNWKNIEPIIEVLP